MALMIYLFMTYKKTAIRRLGSMKAKTEVISDG